jgi:hypothetical protein
MRNSRPILTAVVILATASLAYPVLAHCGKCIVSAKEMLKMMDGAKITLVKAIESAETATSGRALEAAARETDKGLTFEVYTVEGDKIMLASVDGKTGEITGTQEVKYLGGHPGHHQGRKARPMHP